MNRSSSFELAEDIRELARRAGDMGLESEAGRLSLIASDVEMIGSRPSNPPPPNAEARKTATERFRAARAILKGIIR